MDIPGHFNVYNALAAAAVCTLFDVPNEAIQRGLARVKVKGRGEPVPVPGNYTLLIDYAHNAVSMESILTTLREYHPHRLICLFGAGGNRPRARRYELGAASGRLADLSVVTEDILSSPTVRTRSAGALRTRRRGISWCWRARVMRIIRRSGASAITTTNAK